MDKNPLKVTEVGSDLVSPTGIRRRGGKTMVQKMRAQLLMAMAVLAMERLGVTRPMATPKGLGKTYKRKQWAKIKKARKVAKASRKRNRR